MDLTERGFAAALMIGAVALALTVTGGGPMGLIVPWLFPATTTLEITAPVSVPSESVAAVTIHLSLPPLGQDSTYSVSIDTDHPDQQSFDLDGQRLSQIHEFRPCCTLSQVIVLWNCTTDIWHAEIDISVSAPNATDYLDDVSSDELEVTRHEADQAECSG